MGQITKGKVDGPGAVPGASTELSPDSKREKEGTTEQCSVKSATALPLSDTREGLVGDGKELPLPTVRWCESCLEEGVHCALAVDAPEGERVCVYHAKHAVSEGMKRTAYMSLKCARKGCVRSQTAESVFCVAHERCAASVSLDNVPAVPEAKGWICQVCNGKTPAGVDLCDTCRDGDAEQPNDRRSHFEGVMDGALEAAWVALAEDSRLDPLTVATCKRLRDLEGRVRS